MSPDKLNTVKWQKVYIKMGVNPIPTIHTNSLSRPLLLRTPEVSQRSQYHRFILDSKTDFLRVYEFISIGKEVPVTRNFQ